MVASCVFFIPFFLYYALRFLIADIFIILELLKLQFILIVFFPFQFPLHGPRIFLTVAAASYAKTALDINVVIKRSHQQTSHQSSHP